MHQSACEANLDPDRLGFTRAVEVLDTACYVFALVAREELPRMQKRLLADLREPTTLLPPTSPPLLSSRRQARLFLVPSQATGTAGLYPQTAELPGHSSYLNGIAH
jgi:hypothetical protein